MSTLNIISSEADLKKVSDLSDTIFRKFLSNTGYEYVPAAEGSTYLVEKDTSADSDRVNPNPLVASNYTSQVEGPYYTTQFRAFADLFAQIQVEAEILAGQPLFDFTRPELLQKIFGQLVFPDGSTLSIQSVEVYRKFLKKMVGYFLQGATLEAIRGAISDVSGGALVEVSERLGSGLKESFFFDINISKEGGQDFPPELFDIRNNIDIILTALKPAHMAYEYNHLFTDGGAPPKNDVPSFDFDLKFYQEMRKNFSGLSFLTGTGATLLKVGDQYILEDNSRDFRRVRVGADLEIEGTSVNKGKYSVKEVRPHQLVITTWFVQVPAPNIPYRVEMDELGQISPIQVTETVTAVNGKVTTSKGPLVSGWGDESPATPSHVTVSSGSTPLVVSSVDSYGGVLQVTSAGQPYSGPLSVTYWWIPSPSLPFSSLNSKALVLNKWGEGTGGSTSPNVSPFAFKLGLNNSLHPQPRVYSPRYRAIRKHGNPVLNSSGFKLPPDTETEPVLLLNKFTIETSGELNFDKTLQKFTYSVSPEGLIDLSQVDIFVGSVKSVRQVGDPTNLSYKFNSSSQTVQLVNTPYPPTVEIRFSAGGPATSRYLLGQPLDQSELLFYEGATPFRDKGDYSYYSDLSVSNSSDLIDNSLLTFFSDGVLVSDGFVDMSLSSSEYREEEVIKTLSEDSPAPPLYLWSQEIEAGNISLLLSMGLPGITTDQTLLYSGTGPVNNLTRSTSGLSSVNFEVELNTGQTINYIIT